MKKLFSSGFYGSSSSFFDVSVVSWNSIDNPFPHCPVLHCCPQIPNALSHSVWESQLTGEDTARRKDVLEVRMRRPPQLLSGCGQPTAIAFDLKRNWPRFFVNCVKHYIGSPTYVLDFSKQICICSIQSSFKTNR